MLSDIQFETKEIKYRGQVAFTVRGLGLHEISKLLVFGHRGQIDGAIQDISAAYEAGKAKDDGAFETALTNIAVKLPALAMRLIAECAGEPDAVETFGRFPLPVQTEALIAIFNLTFDGEDSLKNFVSGLKSLMQSMSKSVKAAGQIAQIGTKG